ncbi:MAG: gspD [Chitinophagaceae bacterium]|nr:gspD [Chitinophagaceae bacterium]
MKYYLIRTLFIGFIILFQFPIQAQQQEDRFVVLEKKMAELSKDVPGLNEKVEFSVTGASLQEFLGGLATSHELNISIDPTLQIRIYNKFSNEKVANVILFLAREYDLDILFVGSIMSFKKYIAPVQKDVIPVHEILVKYSAYNDLMTLDLKNDTLEKVVKKITQVTRKNLILTSGLASKIVNVYIEDMPFESAINRMAYANQLKLVKTEDNFFVLKPIGEGEDGLDALTKAGDKAKKGKTIVNKASGTTSAPGTGGAAAGASEMHVEIEEDSATGNRYITLSAVNTPINQVIKEVAQEVGANYFLFSDIKGNITTSITRVNFEHFLTYILQGTDHTYKLDGPLYLIGDRKIEGLRANRVIQLKFRSLDAIHDIIPTELKKGVEVKEFKELNSILVSGSLPQINEIEAFITALDRVVPMVMIEVLLLDINKTRSVKTGITAGLGDSTVKTSGTFLPGIDVTLSSSNVNEFLNWLGTNNVFNLGRVTPNFYMTLSALESNNNAEVRSTPKLSTLNGHEASLSIGSTVYYTVQTQNVLNSLTPQTVVTQQYNSVQANMAINIKPVVSGDDQVTLTIDVSVTDFISLPPTGPPPSTTNQFKSIIRVRNEEMVVLGGLERTQKTETTSGVPLLSRIPILKWLFSSRTKGKTKLVSVVFIKPTIIY